MNARRVSILGATGSIGESTTAVLAEWMAREPGAYEVEALTGGGRIDVLIARAKLLRPRFLAVADRASLDDLRAAASAAGLDAEVSAGPEALIEAGARDADWVMSAIVGAAALEPTLAVIRRGATVALANKECLVCAGPLVLETARQSGATLLPVDSEHNAIFQVLTHPDAVEKLILTATGGPFRTLSAAAMAAVTPAQAINHPRWKMGAKISVDSATLMNKGLELIEAGYLFGLPENQIDVVVHPQAIVHSLVAYVDGSVLAQLSEPDMRVPIAYALAWPARKPVATKRLDLAAWASLEFAPPDTTKFPALRLAREAFAAGGAAPAVLNAANETAVAAFLDNRIGFLEITAIVDRVLNEAARGGWIAIPPSCFGDVLAVDARAREMARDSLVRSSL
ncbi:MAG: 1-deoxy-D-xylulose-5-phosphate reductoisomerase [Caulobacterales bacterium]|jgi:1-deoxy-D-xylulose-5-phosphate reductoisomerase